MEKIKNEEEEDLVQKDKIDESIDPKEENKINAEQKEITKNNNSSNKKVKNEHFSLSLGRILKPKVININTSIIEKGLKITLKRGSIERFYYVLFPEEIWIKLPQSLKLTLRDNIALLASLEGGIMLKAKKVSYDTPLPIFKSFFIELLLKCFLYSGDCDSGKTLDYITRLCNMHLTFKGTTSNLENPKIEAKEGCISTMTFGKESLLSYGLATEIGLNPIPVTVTEPDCDVIYRKCKIKTFQNKHKYKLIKKFEEEFNSRVYVVDSNVNEISDYSLWDLDPTDLGWSTQLTQYLFFLLPFNIFFNYKYILYGNEYSCDTFYISDEGFKCSPVYDQSEEWMSHMNTMLHTLTNGAIKSTSLVQPINEMAVAKVLYQRYPHLAKYQMSCHANNEGARHKRWCASCCKCATCFLFMKALGFDSSSVDLEDMFSLKHKELYSIFHQSKDAISGYYSMSLARDEQLFAFHLACKREAQGELIELFKKEYGEEAAAREAELREEFFGLHTPLNIPPVLWKKIKPIFEEELSKDYDFKETDKKVEKEVKVAEPVEKETEENKKTSKDVKELKDKKEEIKKDLEEVKEEAKPAKNGHKKEEKKTAKILEK